MTPSFRQWLRSLSFQIVAVPSTLALISLYFGDTLNRSGLAALLTAIVAVGAASWFWLAPDLSTRPRPIGDGRVIGNLEFDTVVTAVSHRLQTGAQASDSLLARLLAAYQPRHVVLLVSSAAAQTGAGDAAVTIAKDAGVETSTVMLPRGTEANPAALADLAGAAVASRQHESIMVDVTSGNSVMSIGLFSAATSHNVWSGYLELLADEAHVRLIYKPGEAAT